MGAKVTHPENPVFCAIDTSDPAKAARLVAQVIGKVHGLKIGLEYFMAHGADGYRKLVPEGVPVFLDVKLHDIPNTVAGAVKSLAPLKPTFVTVHTSGGPAMMRAAAEAAAAFAQSQGGPRLKLLGVTVLTSLDKEDLAAVGQGGAGSDVSAQVVKLAKLAKACGLDGVICSPEEVRTLRQELGPDFELMVPGIRPVWAAANDQKRVLTPREAVEAGASWLVIGRPITGAQDPAEAAAKIAEELARA